MFSIIKMSPRSEDYLLKLVEYYFRSKAGKKKKKSKGGGDDPTDDDDSPDSDDDGLGLGDAEPYTFDMPGERPGTWFGRGAVRLELWGMIQEQPYRRVFRGLHPLTEEPLVQNAGKPDRRPGWEGCMSAPKDFSVLAYGAPPEWRTKLLKTYSDVCEDTLKMIQQYLAFSRVGKAEEGCSYVRVGLVVAMWEHASSRAGDEDVHYHTQFFNLGVDGLGTVRALDPLPIFRNQRLITAWGRARLAWVLRTKYGLIAEVHGSTYSIRGVPKELVKAKSKRRRQILDRLEELGLSGGEEAARVARETRARKDPLVSRAELIKRWRADNAAAGFDDAHIAELLRHGPRKPTGSIKKVIKEVVKELTRQKNHFTRQELLLQVLYRLPEYGLDPKPTFAKVEDYLTTDPNIVPLGVIDDEQRFTTKRILEEERRMLAALDSMSKRPRRKVSDKNLNKELKKRRTLKQEQADFVRHLTQSGDRFGDRLRLRRHR